MSVYYGNRRKKVRTFATNYTYQSPNIVIIPSISFINPPPLKKIKAENCTDIPTDNPNLCTKVVNDQCRNNNVTNKECLKNSNLGYKRNLNNFKQPIKPATTKTDYNCKTDLSIQKVNENVTSDGNKEVNIVHNLSKENVKDEEKKGETDAKNIEKNLKHAIKSTDLKINNKTEVEKVNTKVDKYTKTKKKMKHSKKINITVNVTFKKLHKEVNKDINNDGNVPSQIIQNPDLSFLDDFDIDELVESLYSKNSAENDIINLKEPMKTNATANNTLEENNKPEIFSSKIKDENNLHEYIKTPEISRTKDEAKNLNKSESCSSDKTLHYCDITQSNKRNIHRSSNLTLPVNARKFKDVDQNTKVNETTLRSEIMNVKNVQEAIFHEQKFNLDVTNKNRTELENFHNSKTIDCTLTENISVLGINKHNFFEDVNYKQNIQNYNFVTKFDKVFAQQLETRFYDNLKINFTVTAVIHYGKFSKIFKCKDSSGQYYAIKVLDNCVKNKLGEKLLNRLQEDIPRENLSCISLLHSFDLNGYRCLMMYYYTSNLEQLLQNNKKPLDINQICHLAKQLVEAVFILRINNIVHSDIKPSHILVNENNDKLKLSGFDEAYNYPCFNRESAIEGLIHYFSPEKILGYSNGYTVDVWSTALVMYKMATNTNLFLGNTSHDVLFEQMSLFGNFTEDMIKGSLFKIKYFEDLNFVRNNANITVQRNVKKLRNWNNIETIIMAMQSMSKRMKVEMKKECSYLFKVKLLSKLLKKMLVLDPKQRLSIEYVLANELFQHINQKSSEN